MLNEYLKFNPKYDFVIKLGISLVLTCCLGPLEIKNEAIVPITLQTLFLLFAAISFGWQVGALNAFMYILLGMAGLPVFSGYHEAIN
jgi:biotin transport system substrate-specific component